MVTLTDENFLCLVLDHLAKERSLDSNDDKSSSPAFENGNNAQLLKESILQTAVSILLFAPITTLLYFYREKNNVWCK